jgi:hypothetical protein
MLMKKLILLVGVVLFFSFGLLGMKKVPGVFYKKKSDVVERPVKCDIWKKSFLVSISFFAALSFAYPVHNHGYYNNHDYYYKAILAKPIFTYDLKKENYLILIFNDVFRISSDEGKVVAKLVVEFTQGKNKQDKKGELLQFSFCNMPLLVQENVRFLWMGKKKYIPSKQFYDKGVAGRSYFESVERHRNTRFLTSPECKFAMMFSVSYYLACKQM